jgi:hypothetical protein
VTLEQIGMAVMALIILIGVVAAIADFERKPKRKSNIRLPRTTAWDRARGYYGDTK